MIERKRKLFYEKPCMLCMCLSKRLFFHDLIYTIFICFISALTRGQKCPIMLKITCSKICFNHNLVFLIFFIWNENDLWVRQTTKTFLLIGLESCLNSFSVCEDDVRKLSVGNVDSELVLYRLQGAAKKSSPLKFFAFFSATVWNFNWNFYSFIY